MESTASAQTKNNCNRFQWKASTPDLFPVSLSKSNVQSGATCPMSSLTKVTTDTRLKLGKVIKGLSKLQKELDVMRTGKSAASTVPSGSGHEGLPPSPSKTAGEVKNSHLECTPLTNQANDASDFMIWREPPQDVCERMKAWEDRLTAQTNASMTWLQNSVLTNHIISHPREEFFHLNCNKGSTTVTAVDALHFNSLWVSITQVLPCILSITLSHQCMVGTNLFLISHSGANSVFELLVFSMAKIAHLVTKLARMHFLSVCTLVTALQRKSSLTKNLQR